MTGNVDERIWALRRVAEDPTVRPSVRLAARLALKPERKARQAAMVKRMVANRGAVAEVLSR
jgi:hypothetical protein